MGAMMRTSRKTYLGLALPLFGLVLVGCGGPNVVPVSGTLTYKGRPVSGAVILFTPTSGRQCAGETDDEGHFELAYDEKVKGALIGKHHIFIQPKMGKPAPTKEVAPAFSKYSAANSKKDVEITSDTKVLNLELD
jgi:hypothetical protein